MHGRAAGGAESEGPGQSQQDDGGGSLRAVTFVRLLLLDVMDGVEFNNEEHREEWSQFDDEVDCQLGGDVTLQLHLPSSDA